MKCPRCGSHALRDHREWWCPHCGTISSRGALFAHNTVAPVGRAKAHAERAQAPWEPWEADFVRANLTSMSLRQLGARLNRTEAAIRGFLRTKGLRKESYVMNGPRGPRKAHTRRQGAA